MTASLVIQALLSSMRKGDEEHKYRRVDLIINEEFRQLLPEIRLGSLQ